jgi:hypothetical protein
MGESMPKPIDAALTPVGHERGWIEKEEMLDLLGKGVRVFEKAGEEPLYINKQVCTPLGWKNSRAALENAADRDKTQIYCLRQQRME